jgi:hypothetical protein
MDSVWVGYVDVGGIWVDEEDRKFKPVKVFQDKAVAEQWKKDTNMKINQRRTYFWHKMEKDPKLTDMTFNGNNDLLTQEIARKFPVWNDYIRELHGYYCTIEAYREELKKKFCEFLGIGIDWETADIEETEFVPSHTTTTTTNEWVPYSGLAKMNDDPHDKRREEVNKKFKDRADEISKSFVEYSSIIHGRRQPDLRDVSNKEK